MKKPAIIVHGGAGTFPEHRREAAVQGCEEAARAGYLVLQEGGTALDAVEKAVMLLEDNPVFIAGTGSHPNTAGEVEMDAILVDGATLDFGAVTAICNVQHPVSVARKVMEATPHCMLAGTGATRFAHESGFEFVPTETLRATEISGSRTGTVGAVALDAAGTIASATSTGGTRGKLPGRVGDSPIIGSGAIADNAYGGASATGQGEDIMKVQLCRTVLELLAKTPVAMDAVKEAIAVVERRVQGEAGVICLDTHGTPAYAYNTQYMARASIAPNGAMHSGI